MAKANPFRFSTKFQDDETDLLYYGYRYYSASTGRWQSRDPIAERGGRNVYGFVLNDPLDHYDIVGLTIPGQCAAAYPNWCPCKCVSVTVTYSPGNDSFKWDWLPNPAGGQRFGNDMTVVWKVEGPAGRCKFSQLESGDFYLVNILNSNAKTRHAGWSNHTVVDSHGQACWGERSYTDAIGGMLGGGFTSPADDGNWEVQVVTPPKITVVCESSDGTKKSQEVSIPPPQPPGKFPP